MHSVKTKIPVGHYNLCKGPLVRLKFKSCLFSVKIIQFQLNVICVRGVTSDGLSINATTPEDNFAKKNYQIIFKISWKLSLYYFNSKALTVSQVYTYIDSTAVQNCDMLWSLFSDWSNTYKISIRSSLMHCEIGPLCCGSCDANFQNHHLPWTVSHQLIGMVLRLGTD